MLIVIEYMGIRFFLIAVIVVVVAVAVLRRFTMMLQCTEEMPNWCAIAGVGGYVSQLGEQHSLLGPVSKDKA